MFILIGCITFVSMPLDDSIRIIKVKKETYEELTDLGKKNHTYDQIIQNLLKSFKESGKSMRD